MSGSLVNMISEQTQSLTPEIGMGATEIHYSDRYAGTITAISKSGKSLRWTRDIATRTDSNGASESQTYTFAPGTNAHTFTLRRNGRWVREGDAMRGGTTLLVGKRDEYYDYSF